MEIHGHRRDLAAHDHVCLIGTFTVILLAEIARKQLKKLDKASTHDRLETRGLQGTSSSN